MLLHRADCVTGGQGLCAALIHAVLRSRMLCCAAQIASMVAKVSQLSQTNQLVRRRLRLEVRPLDESVFICSAKSF